MSTNCIRLWYTKDSQSDFLLISNTFTRSISLSLGIVLSLSLSLSHFNSLSLFLSSISLSLILSLSFFFTLFRSLSHLVSLSFDTSVAYPSAWEKLARKELGGEIGPKELEWITPEGIKLKPLYTGTCSVMLYL